MCAAAASDWAVERDDPLVAVHPPAGIDRQRQVPGAEQATLVPVRASHPLRVEAGIAAQPAGAFEINDEKRQWSVRLGLHDELAVELQRAADQRRQGEGLTQGLADRLGIVVPRQHLIDDATEPHQPPAHAGPVGAERQDQVVGNGGGARGRCVSRIGHSVSA